MGGGGRGDPFDFEDVGGVGGGGVRGPESLTRTRRGRVE